GRAVVAPDGGPASGEGRYSLHLLPLVVLVLAVALSSRPTSPAHAAPPAAPRRAFPRAVAAAVWLAIAAAALVPAATRYAWAVQNINAMQGHLGDWVDAQLPKS